MKLMLLAASLRKDSINKKLIDLAKNHLEKSGIIVDVADFADYNVPLYNQDDQDNKGFPEAVTAFIKRMQEADGLVIATPEYNFSIPGTLKNLIDWVSRPKPMPWDGVIVNLMSASPSNVGGWRALLAASIPLDGCGAFVYPKMYSLPNAYEAFTTDGSFKEESRQASLEKNLNGFVEYIKKLTK